MPRSPLDSIVYAKLGETVGTFERSALYVNPANGWSIVGDDEIPYLYVTTKPVCLATATEQGAKVAEAAQWTLQHQTMFADTETNPKTPLVAPPVSRVLVLRAGVDWKNELGIRFTAELTDLQMTLVRNLMTRGDEQGTLPVIALGAATASTTETLTLSLADPGAYSLALCGTNANGYAVCLELEVWAVS